MLKFGRSKLYVPQSTMKSALINCKLCELRNIFVHMKRVLQTHLHLLTFCLIMLLNLNVAHYLHFPKMFRFKQMNVTQKFC